MSKKENEPTPHCQADADARRDAWIAQSGAKPIPRSCGPSTAQKDAEAAANRSQDVHLAAAQQSKKTDPKLADDPLGNAIPGVLGGGVVAAGSAISAGAHVTAAVAKHLVEHAAAETAHHLGAEGAHAVAPMAKDAGSAVAKKAAEAWSGTKQAHAAWGATLPETTPVKPSNTPTAPATGGRSGARGVSEEAKDGLDGGASKQPPPVGRDAIPYRPGHAPVRIPEALPQTVSIRG